MLGALVLFVAPIGYYIKRIRQLKRHFAGFAKASNNLLPTDLMPIRGQRKHGFHDFYYERDFDATIREMIRKGLNVLVIGRQRAGKTRAVFEALRTYDPPISVYVPRLGEMKLEDLPAPKSTSALERSVLVLDDVDKFSKFPSTSYLMQMYDERGVTIVGTCRSGDEYNTFCKNMEQERSLFDQPIVVGQVTTEQANEIATGARTVVPRSFDGTVGSVFVDFDTLRMKYNECTPEEICVLKAVKRLYDIGVYRDSVIFLVIRVKRICECTEGLNVPDYQWKGILKSLNDKALIDLLGDSEIRTEETYLLELVQTERPSFQQLQEFRWIFENDSEALVEIAECVTELPSFSEKQVDHLRFQVACLTQSMAPGKKERWTESDARAQWHLGIAHSSLAELENRTGNYQRAAKAFEKALKSWTSDSSSSSLYPLFRIALTQSHLGQVYEKLSGIRNKRQNLRRAVEHFRLACEPLSDEPLKGVPNLFDLQLGLGYLKLARIEDQVPNFRLAIAALERALNSITLERASVIYADIHLHLGNAYLELAENDDWDDNCLKAKVAYEEALRVTPESYYYIRELARRGLERLTNHSAGT